MASRSKRTRRAVERTSIEAEIVMRRAGFPNFRVAIEDISSDGCKIQFVDRPITGERVWVKFDGLQTLGATVCWVREHEAGLHFDAPIHAAVLESLLDRLH